MWGGGDKFKSPPPTDVSSVATLFNGQATLG